MQCALHPFNFARAQLLSKFSLEKPLSGKREQVHVLSHCAKLSTSSQACGWRLCLCFVRRGLQRADCFIRMRVQFFLGHHSLNNTYCDLQLYIFLLVYGLNAAVYRLHGSKDQAVGSLMISGLWLSEWWVSSAFPCFLHCCSRQQLGSSFFLSEFEN